MSASAAIVGSGSTPYYFRGESAPQTLFELLGKAILDAVADAGLTIDEVDGLAFFAFGFDTPLLIEMLGLRNITFAACVSGYGGGLAGMLDLAKMAVETGRAKNVVARMFDGIDISEKDKADILGGNAARLFRLNRPEFLAAT